MRYKTIYSVAIQITLKIKQQKELVYNYGKRVVKLNRHRRTKDVCVDGAKMEEQ